MNELIAFAKVLADASAQVIRPYFRAQFTTEYKSDLSPVTIADKSAEETMRELIMREFPEHGILGEEFGVHNSGAEYQWVLDPIDGTKSFISGNVLFGTLIALTHHGRPIIGVINQPIVNDYIIGANGETLLNGKRVHVRACERIEDATLLMSSHWDAHNFQNGPAFDELSKRARIYRSWGDCHGYFSVATGFADVTMDAIMNPWDIMAVVPIIEGAGGRITDWQGGDAVTGTSTVASAGPLHDEIIRALNP